MSTAFVNGVFQAGPLLIPNDKVADVIATLKSSAPKFYAAAYIDLRYGQRLMPCADAVWCAQQLSNPRTRSEEVGNAIAGYARRFSHEAHASLNPLTSLTAISVLGYDDVRRAVLEMEGSMDAEVAQRLRLAVSKGDRAQQYAAAQVLGRYAIDAAKDFCDGSFLLVAMSALAAVASALHNNRSKLYPDYGPLILSTLRSLASVSRYVGKNDVSTKAMDSLSKVASTDEIAVVKKGAAMAVAAIEAEPELLLCGPAITFSSGSNVSRVKGMSG